MPRPKINVFVNYSDKPVIRSIKVGHDIDTDSYWIDVKEAKDKLTAQSILFEYAYILRDFEKYYFSNILIEKTKYKVNIKAIFEKSSNNNFISNDNIEDYIDNIDFDTIPEYSKPLYFVNIAGLTINNVRKNIYLVGSYIIRDNTKMYLSQFELSNMEKEFELDCTFSNLENCHLYKERPYLFNTK